MQKFANRLDKSDHNEALIHQAMGHVAEGWSLQFPRELSLRDLRGLLDEETTRIAHALCVSLVTETRDDSGELNQLDPQDASEALHAHWEEVSEKAQRTVRNANKALEYYNLGVGLVLNPFVSVTAKVLGIHNDRIKQSKEHWDESVKSVFAKTRHLLSKPSAMLAYQYLNKLPSRT